MLAYVLTALLSMPIYPLNPTAQDTLNDFNLHLTAGFTGPNGIVSAGPDLTMKYEWKFMHPFVARTAVDYRFGQVHTLTRPRGNIHRVTFSVEGLYYRGTDKLTGYFGLGLVYMVNDFDLSQLAGDSLLQYEGVTDVGISESLGYRISAGLRFQRVFSLEIAITEARPDFLHITQFSPDRYKIAERPFRSNDVRITFGYLITLKG